MIYIPYILVLALEFIIIIILIKHLKTERKAYIKIINDQQTVIDEIESYKNAVEYIEENDNKFHLH